MKHHLKDMEPFARTTQLLGPEAIKTLSQAKIAVFGLGAVGGFVVEALARSGIGYLRLIDFDQIEASNLNRQILGLHSTIGQQKTQLAKERISDIHPDCHVDAHCSFVNSESLGQFLSRDLDIVIDAIDGLNSKVNLIYEARQMGLTILSSMGAAGRTDLTSIHLADIKKSSVCPLARMVRRRLHRRGLFEGVECVFSTEKPLNKDPSSNPEESETSRYIDETTQPPYGHSRIRPPIGSVVWVPAVFGMMLAARAVELLLHPPAENRGKSPNPS